MVGVWGFSFIAIEVALREVGPGQLVSLRFLPAFVIFAAMSLPKLLKGSRRPKGRDLLQLVITGIFGVIVYNLALNTGQTHLPASLAALVIALNPASIAIVASLWIGEKPSLRTWGGLLLGLAGILIVILGRHGAPEIRIQYIIGALITLGAPLSWGIYTTGIRRAAPKFGALTTTTTAITVGSIPLLFTINAPLIDTVRHASPSLIISVLFLSIGCTVYGFTAWAKVLKNMEAAKAGAFIYLVPLIAAVGSYWLLDEPIDLPLIGGGLLVLGGVGIATGRLAFPRFGKAATPEAPTPPHP